jgi:hypothetical protein
MLIYASDASAVWGFRQIGGFYDRNIARVMNFLGVSNLSHPRLMMVKGVMSIASIAYGLWAVNFAYDGAVADLKKSEANLQQNQVYLKSGGSAPFGLGVILDFSSFASSQQNFRSELKTIITETLITLEKSGILKGYNQF